MTISIFGRKRLILDLRVERRSNDVTATGALEMLRARRHHERELDEMKNSFFLIRGPHL